MSVNTHSCCVQEVCGTSPDPSDDDFDGERDNLPGTNIDEIGASEVVVSAETMREYKIVCPPGSVSASL